MTRTSGWSRRAVLAAGIGSLAACGTTHPATGPSSPAPPVSTRPTPPVSPASPSGPVAIPWSRLRRHLSGQLVRPGDPGYASLRLTPNPRYDDARPLALLEAAHERDVATGLAFAADHGIPIALRSGGHSYPGWSSGGSPRALVIDCRRLSALSWRGTAATLGPGTALADVYTGVAGRGRAIPGGSCPTVGLGGLTLGGGVGVLTRAYGLTCDGLTSARVVLADGRVVTASTDSEPDLFWALRGGGGGHLGVVTSLTFDTVAAPTLTTTYLTWPAVTVGDVVPAWLDWMDAADARLWSTLKLLGGSTHPSGPSLGATVTWVGPTSAFDSALAPLLRHAPAPTSRTDHVRGYLDAMRAYAGSGERQAFAATSHVVYGAVGSDAVATMADRVAGVPSSLTEGGISIDALGGRVADLAPGDTAFVHRAARATVQYTATYAAGSARSAVDFVEGFRSAMTPFLGNHAYVNYADPSLTDPGTAYFGANWPRLRRVRAAYDPHRLFTQPQ